jgi:Protein of unknown function (DUF499)/Fn3 associated
MKSLKQLCTPRESIFDFTKRDTVLNLAHLVNSRIDPESFFEENYVTDGMRTLLLEGFRRLDGKSEQAVFKLTQAMGGGKTHSLLTLGMLSMHPEFRARVLTGLPDARELPAVRVVAFDGRETDVVHGVWGEIARQIKKFDTLKDYYSPMKAPGRTAWINLLKGEPTLILLDELPFYLDNARSFAIGNSDLAKVTATALTNLFNAIAERELGNVCVVLTDLIGTYAEASAEIQKVLEGLQNEAQRSAMNLTPVQMNTDEFYHVLRKRLFKLLPGDDEVDAVAQAYAKAVCEAKQMDITAQSPEQFAQHVKSSYPFHPAIKDLYGRFRENPGFQQTRALIRLMRIIASGLWQSGEAERKYLISVEDLDLNDAETLSEIRQINPTLENAVSHDIAAQGKAVAEVMDQNLGGNDARDACRLLFVASLANVPNAVLGLSIPELIGYLCAPGRNLTKLKGDVLEKLATAAWFLHSNRDGKLFFRNVENLNAKLESLARAYVREQSLKELRQRLTDLFQPLNGWCYQEVLSLPAMDEIDLALDCVTLVISEPYVGQGLNPQLRQFWEQTTFKNRVAFLTGSRNTFENLVENAKRLKAIDHIMGEMQAEHLSAADPQFKQADELHDRILGQFLSSLKETFSTLYYPTRQSEKDALNQADFLMKYEANKYNGEDQVMQVLKDKQKFTEDISSDIFRKKVEQRLFTTMVMLWSEVKKRAAINAQWQWHRRDALDALKVDMLHKEIWREDAGYVDRSSPPPKTTLVHLQERSRDEDTGLVELKVTPINGDTVYAEIGGEASTASQKVENGLYVTDEIEASFLAVDSSGVHVTGPTVSWKNRVTLKYRFFTGGSGERMIELKVAPYKLGETRIRYTTDGSDPKLSGDAYDSPAAIPKGTQFVLAFAECAGVQSEILQTPVPVGKGPVEEKPIDPNKPAIWKRPHACYFTNESYEFLDRLKRHEAKISGVKLSITGDRWLELTLHDLVELDAPQVSSTVETLRALPVTGNGQVEVTATALHFLTGQRLLDWLNEVKTDVKPDEVKQ